MAVAERAGRAEQAGIRATFTEAPFSVKMVIVGIFINRLSAFLNIFLVLFLTANGYSAQKATIALGVYGGGAVVGVLIGGTLSSRLGSRNATVLSMVGTGVFTAALLSLPSYPLLLVLVALSSLSAQLYRPASATLLSQLAPEDRQVMTFAMYRFGLNLGATAAPLLGLGLYDLGGHHYGLFFWCESLIAVAFGLAAWRTLPARDPAARAVAAAPAQSRGGYRAMLRDHRYTLYLLAILIHSAVYVQYLSTLPLNVKSAGLPMYWYTLAVSLNGFIVIAFELLVTKVTQSWPMRVSIGLTLALLGVGVAGYGLPFGPAVVLGGTLVWSLGEIIGGPATFAYPGLAGPAHLKSYYIGGFQFMFGLGSAIGPAVGGWLFLRLGHGSWPVLALGSAAATALALLSIRRPAPAGPAAAEPAAVSGERALQG
jgi:predicted MFS family arabinose efflux permease